MIRFQVVLPPKIYNSLVNEAAEETKKKGKTVSIAAVLRAHALCNMRECAANKTARKKFLDTLETEI